MPRSRSTAVILTAVLALPVILFAQVPAGPEFRVNTHTPDYQINPKIALGSNGDFVVVWTQRAGPGDYDVLGQRFDSTGPPIGAEFRVNTYTTGRQEFPDVAMDARGNFVVVWAAPYPALMGVFAQIFDAAGQPRGGEFQVNSSTFNAGYPRVAMTATGAFVVAWHSAAIPIPSALEVSARAFAADGTPRGPDFPVNLYTTGRQSRPVIAADEAGNFVVAWEHYTFFESEVIARLFAASTTPLSGEFRVNTYGPGAQHLPGIAMARNGAFVVGWESFQQDGSFDGVFGQRFESSGAPRGGEFQLSSFTSDIQSRPVIAMDDTGAFVASWSSWMQDGSDYAVAAQRYDANGLKRGVEFIVNSFTPGRQRNPAVVSDPVGNFTVTWISRSQDGSGDGIFGQRFGGLRPTALRVDPTGNGVFDPDENAAVQPSWRNVNGSAQTFGGTLSGITGPAGMTYTITDATASYGTVANGATSPCTDCYAVWVSNAATRPRTHIDASAVETITPGNHGQMKEWLLHVGRSFSDVPAASPFYRFIETLLHHGVTGGCSVDSYCPLAPTSRAQMAVFVLLGKEGPGYAPLPCGATPMFADVPVSSGFCRWIEELARRGVVAGCGNGNYCPTGDVSREQMPVFVLRTLDPTLSPPDCVPPNIYADVPETNEFCRWIEELTNRSVVTGCGDGRYCPRTPVTREQMGVFISATFGLTLYGP